MMYLSRMEFIECSCKALLNHLLLSLGFLTFLTCKNPLK